MRTASKAITELADANTVLACCLAHPPHLAFTPLARVPTACIGSQEHQAAEFACEFDVEKLRRAEME